MAQWRLILIVPFGALLGEIFKRIALLSPILLRKFFLTYRRYGFSIYHCRSLFVPPLRRKWGQVSYSVPLKVSITIQCVVFPDSNLSPHKFFWSISTCWCQWPPSVCVGNACKLPASSQTLLSFFFFGSLIESSGCKTCAWFSTNNLSGNSLIRYCKIVVICWA